MIKTLFQTGTRVEEFVHVRREDLLLDGDPPQIPIPHAKRQAERYLPILPTLADELRTHLRGQQRGFLFESNRHNRYSTRTVQSIVKDCARQAGITKRVYPHRGVRRVSRGDGLFVASGPKGQKRENL